MFGQMMHGVWQDFIRYVMHVDVKVNRPTPVDAATPADAPTPADATPRDAAVPAATPAVLADDVGETALRDVQYSSPDDASNAGGAASLAVAAQAQAAATGEPSPGGGRGTATATANAPVVKSEWDKTPRNAPCPCGSGKKYKLCHGKQ
jgi:preprotein translocase subunit SecA